MDWRKSFDFHSALLISSTRTTSKTTLTSRPLPPRIAIRSFQAMNPFHFPSSTTKVYVFTLLRRRATLINRSYTAHPFLPLARGLTRSQPLVRLPISHRRKKVSHSVLLPLPRPSLLQSCLSLAQSWITISSRLLPLDSKAGGLNRVLLRYFSCLLRELSLLSASSSRLTADTHSGNALLDVPSSPPLNTPKKIAHPFARHSGRWLVSSTPTRSLH